MRWIMAAFFVGGFWLHLAATQSLVSITPDWVPFPREVVLLTGVLELAGALGLLIPRLRWWAGVALAVYVLAVWPANMKHAFMPIALPSIPDSWWYHALFCAGVTDWPLRR